MTKVRAKVNKLIPFSSVDGLGNRFAIFLQGCNLDCLYCHNPETINHCNHCGKCIAECPVEAVKKNGEKEGKVVWNNEKCIECGKCISTCERDSSPKIRLMTVEEVIGEVKKVKSFISGITISGGECSLQIDFVKELFKEVKKLGLDTYVDSNGAIPLYNDKDLMEVMDKAMIDVKSFDSQEHIKLTGMDNKTVIENVEKLGDMGKLYEIRTVIVPDVLDNEYNVDKISELLTSINSNIRYKLIKYRPMGVRTDRLKSHVPSDEFMDCLKAIAINNGCQNVIVV